MLSQSRDGPCAEASDAALWVGQELDVVREGVPLLHRVLWPLSRPVGVCIHESIVATSFP